MIDLYKIDTMHRHLLGRIGITNHPVLVQARDFYWRMTYADALYFTYNMQYWCVNKSDKDYWSAVRAEIKVIYSYRRDES